jgi:NADP-dependent 3-hydroxy acid dehydrogenase YdfG
MGTSNIADKVVVITGASCGIGESTARLLAAQRVVLGARRKDRIERSCQGHYREGGSALGCGLQVIEHLVELVGIEPTASSLRTTRSPS